MSLTYMCYQAEVEDRDLYTGEVRKFWRMCGVGHSPRMAILDALHNSIEENESFLSIFMSKEPTPYDHIKAAQYLGPDEKEDSPGNYYRSPCDAMWYALQRSEYWPFHCHNKPVIDRSGVITTEEESAYTDRDFYEYVYAWYEARGLKALTKVVERVRLKCIETSCPA